MSRWNDEGQAATEFLVAALCTMVLVWGILALIQAMSGPSMFEGLDASVSHAADSNTSENLLGFADPLDFVLDVFMY